MKDVEIIGMLKSYVKASLVGMGALKGAACQIQSITDSGTSHTITFKWEDNNGVSHTDTLTLVDGADEFSELTDVQIASLQNDQVLAYDSESSKWKNKTFSATVASLNEVGDVTITSVADGQVLKWDDTASKWVNATLADVAFSGDATDLSFSKTGMTATNVDAAIKENADEITQIKLNISQLSASQIGYDGTTSGLSADDVQEAIDELTDEKADKSTTLSGYGITDAYTKTETDSAIATEIGKLDVTDTAVAGSYVTEVSETDGKIAVVREAADATPTASSNKMVKSGGVYTAIEDSAGNVSETQYSAISALLS